MPAIDVHTHMLTLDNLELALQRHRTHSLKQTGAGQDCQGQTSRYWKDGARVRA